uniref:DM2 domain-containing protein n=1 Tax=viral metagenome TaxID=1070528 RepID=A0A6C0HNP4_9ZZZZ
MSAIKEPKSKQTKPKAPKSVPVEVPVEVPPPAPVPTPVAPEPVKTDPVTPEVTPIGDVFANLNRSLVDLTVQLSALKMEVKLVEKHVSKELRILDKLNAKKNKNKGNRAPSGFVKPTKISDELAVFLGRESGTLMARTDVTKQITAYVRSNNLQAKENGRLILADDKLKKLLKYDEKTVTDPTQQLSYFNLQKYLSCHFEKAVPA